jgi:hypothetical protein
VLSGSCAHTDIPVAGSVSPAHGAVGESGLSERYRCESPLNNSTGRAKAVVSEAISPMTGS